MASVRVLVVSPFPAERSALDELLRDEGYDVSSWATRAEALAVVATSRPDVIIADAQVSGFDGSALLRELASLGPPPHTILLCPRSNHGLAPPGVVCLTKPIDLAQLFDHLARSNPSRVKVA